MGIAGGVDTHRLFPGVDVADRRVDLHGTYMAHQVRRSSMVLDFQYYLTQAQSVAREKHCILRYLTPLQLLKILNFLLIGYNFRTICILFSVMQGMMLTEPYQQHSNTHC